MPDQLLDTGKKYIVLGKDEQIWSFAFESEDYVASANKCWMAYSKKPGSFFIAKGPRTEKEVYNFLVECWHKLDDDDKIDLYLFLEKGGIENFLEENRNGNNTGRRNESSRE